MKSEHLTFFIIDVSPELLDAYRRRQGVAYHIGQAFILPSRRRYSAIVDELNAQLGHCDYVGALISCHRALVLWDGASSDSLHRPRGLGDGPALVLLHNEGPSAEERHPDDYYYFAHEKAQLVASVKKLWGDRVTTIFTRQQEAAAPRVLDSLGNQHLEDLVADDLSSVAGLLSVQRQLASVFAE